MARFSTHEARRIREVAAEIGTLRTNDAAAASRTLDAIRDLVGTEHAVFVVMAHDAAGVRAERAALSGDPTGQRGSAIARSFNDLSPSARRHAFPWDPLAIEGWQRNRVVSTALVREVTQRDPNAMKAAQVVHSVFGRADTEFIRLAVAEDRHMVAVAAGIQWEAAEAAQLMRMRALSRAICARLAFEHRVDAAGWALPILDHLFDDLGVAAFVLAADGRIVHANAPGRAMLDRPDGDCRLAIRAALAGRRDRFDVLDLPSAEGARYVLVSRSAPIDAAARADEWSARLGLSNREADVLRVLVRGETNKGIASELKISVRTVEGYVSSVMARVGVSSRAKLVARLLGDG